MVTVATIVDVKDQPSDLTNLSLIKLKGIINASKYVAKCLGWKYGTGCMRTMKSPKSKNMRDDQLCFPCAQIVLPKKYGDAKGHGKGGKFSKNLGHYEFAVMPEKPIIQVSIK
jgi:hypothetical protein